MPHSCLIWRLYTQAQTAAPQTCKDETTSIILQPHACIINYQFLLYQANSCPIEHVLGGLKKRVSNCYFKSCYTCHFSALTPTKNLI